MELAAAGEDGKALRNVARRLIQQAETGDLQAIKELADRIDGKAVQQTEISGSLAVTHEEALDALR